jgi:hypothetical protein
VNLPGVADGGLSNVVTLLTNQVVIVLRSRCLIDAVVYVLVSEPLRSSTRLPGWRTWSHRLVVIVHCEGSVVNVLNSCELWTCPSQWYCALTENGMSLWPMSISLIKVMVTIGWPYFLIGRGGSYRNHHFDQGNTHWPQAHAILCQGTIPLWRTSSQLTTVEHIHNRTFTMDNNNETMRSGPPSRQTSTRPKRFTDQNIYDRIYQTPTPQHNDNLISEESDYIW